MLNVAILLWHENIRYRSRIAEYYRRRLDERFLSIRQTGKLAPAHFYLGWRLTDVEQRPTAVRPRLAVVLRIVSGTEKKKHLIEAAPFGCLDQMLRMAVYRGRTHPTMTLSPPPLPDRPGGRPPDHKKLT